MKYPAVYKISQVLITFVLVFFSWIFFRANNMRDALLVIRKTFDFSSEGKLNLFRFDVDFYIAFGTIIFLLLVEYFEEYAGLSVRIRTALPRPVKWVILSLFLLVIFVLGVWEEANFLYFQF